jgi:hypothetical protein
VNNPKILSHDGVIDFLSSFHSSHQSYDAFRNEFNVNKKFFFDFIKTHFSKEYDQFTSASGDKIEELIRKLTITPSDSNFNELSDTITGLNSLGSDKEYGKKVLRHLLNTDKHVRELQENYVSTNFDNMELNNWGTQDMLGLIEDIYLAKSKGEEVPFSEDMPFSYYIQRDEEFGDVDYFEFKNSDGRYRFGEDFLFSIYNTMKSDTNAKYSLHFNPDKYDQDLDEAATELGVEVLDTNAYILKTNDNYEYEMIYDLGNNFGKPDHVTSSDFSRKSIEEAIKGKIYLDKKSSTDIIKKWFYEQKSKYADENYFYIDFMKNNVVLEDIVKALRDESFGAFVHGHKVIDTKDYDSEEEYRYGNVLMFAYEAAMEMFSQIPENIASSSFNSNRRGYSAREGYHNNDTFVLTSGLFSCQKVFDIAMLDLDFSKKILKHIKCNSGNADEIRTQIESEVNNRGLEGEAAGKFVSEHINDMVSKSDVEISSVHDLLSKEIRKKESKANNEIRDGFRDFVNSNRVEKLSIGDFPNLKEFVLSFLNRHLSGGEEVYDHKTGGYISPATYAMSYVESIPIYMINPNVISNEFGTSITGSGIDPTKVNGVFSNDLYGTGQGIIVYTEKGKLDGNSILTDVLGLEGDMYTLGEEGTVWHEISHALSNQVLGRDPNDKSGNDDSIDEWMQSAEEMLAISYGNMGYIKAKLREYFTSEFPFPQRITEGLLEKMKTDIVNTFGFEFNGMSKDDAYAMIGDTIESFDEEMLSILNSITPEEQIETMVGLFTEFFMGGFMRGKVEDEIQKMKKQMMSGGSREPPISFSSPKAVPEKYEYKALNQRDKFISEFEKRPDYQEFFSKVQNRLDENIWNLGIVPPNFKRYVHRSEDTAIQTPFDFSDLLKFLFQLPATVESANINNINPDFEDLIPQSLLKDVIDIANKELELSKTKGETKLNPDPITPDEAEEGGRFMAEMDDQYGPDWIWLANNWYQMIKMSSSVKGRKMDNQNCVVYED